MLNNEDIQKVLEMANKPEPPAEPPAKQGADAVGQETAAQTKPTETTQTETVQPDPVTDVLAEYGVAADSTSPAGLNPEVLSNRISELEAELEMERERKWNPVYNLSEDELNDKVEKLRDDGKHTEAEKMLKEWSEKDQRSPQNVMEARRKAAEREVLGYISQGNGNEKLAELLQDKDLQPVLKDLTGIINLHLPGAARVLHRLCLGFKVANIARKAEERGRNSITMSPPATQRAAGVESKLNLVTGHRKVRPSDRLNF